MYLCSHSNRQQLLEMDTVRVIATGLAGLPYLKLQSCMASSPVSLTAEECCLAPEQASLLTLHEGHTSVSTVC